MDFMLSCIFGLLLGICLADHHESDSVCNLPPEPGLCYALFTRFYYDASSGKCKDFTYGGCGGNGNRFETEKECMDRCGRERLGRSEEGKFPSAICNQDKQPGNCSSQINRYYFNKDSKKCEHLVYTGCGENENNFVYLFECERTCLGEDQLGDICSLDSVSGPCLAYIPRFFFNKQRGHCEEFIFGGCGGNHNNFEKKEECESYCKPKSAVTEPSKNSNLDDVCALEKQPGPCKAYMPRYYFNGETGKCEQFTYGGCSGNGNNFQKNDECERACKAETNPSS